jgi:hypothetical protein
MTPPLPTIPSQPTVAAATGGTWASGNSQTDASGSQLFDEYAEYRQWLHVEYSRNPIACYPGTDTLGYSLTQVSSTETRNVASTDLHYKVTAHTSCTIVSGVYAASSFYQPQKLSMTPYQLDKEGIGYGSVDGSGVVFGTHGTITTTQPYINRRPKNALDFPYNETHTGTTHGLIFSSTYHPNAWKVGSNTTQPYEYYLNDHNDLAAADNNHQARSMVNGYDRFVMNGAYNVCAEPGYLDLDAGMQRFEQFVESLAATLTNTNFYYRLATELPTGVPVDHNQRSESNTIPAMTKYNSGFHDYT